MTKKSHPPDIWVRLDKGIRYREHPTRRHGVRKDRYFVLRYTVSGKRKQESLGWASEGMNLEKARLILAEIKESIRIGSGPTSLAQKRAIAEQKQKAELEKHTHTELAQTTFSSFWESEYLPSAKLSKASETIRTEQHLYSNWVKPSLGQRPLQSITTSDIEIVKNKVLSAQKSAATIRYILAIISQVWNYANTKNIVTGQNPVRKIKKPSQDNRRMRFLTKEEANTLLAMLKTKSQDTHDTALISLLCGLRAGEIHALTWGDIDFNEGLITIIDPKNRKNRYAYMVDEVRNMLEQRYNGHSKTEYVFPATGGKKRQQISDTFFRVVDSLGLNDSGDFEPDETGQLLPVKIKDQRQKVVFHTLRHTFASWLVQAGTPIYNVAELLGHSSLEMTKRYAHLAPDALRADVMKLQGMLKKSDAVNGKKEDEDGSKTS